MRCECVISKEKKKRKKKCSCVAKLLNSCGFSHRGLILLQKLLSLFATWLEPISKYRNVSCNNLNELTIVFSGFICVWFCFGFYLVFESSFGFAILFAAIFAWKINNFVDFLFLRSEVWQFGCLNQRFSSLLSFLVPCFSLQMVSRYVCRIFFRI